MLKSSYLLPFILLFPPTSFSQSAELFLKLGHTSHVNSLAFGDNGKCMATGSADNTVRIWDAETGDLLRTLAGHEADIFAIAVNPDGRTLASAGYDAKIILWEIASGRILITLREHRQPVTTLAFDPRGELLASGGRDGIVNLWKPQTGETLHSLQAHADAVSFVGFSPAGGMLASAGRDGLVKIWNVAAGTQMAAFEPHETVSGLAFSPDSKWLLSTGRNEPAKVWEVGTWRPVKMLASPARCGVFGPDGRYLATGSSSGEVEIWRTSSWERVASQRQHEGLVLALAFEAQGRRVASAGQDSVVKVWDLASRQIAWSLQAEPRTILDVDFAPPGNVLATAHHNGSLKLWNVAGGQLLHNVKAHSASVSAIDFRSDGRRLATGSADGRAKIWDIKNRQLVRVFHGHRATVWDVRFSRGGQRLATCSADSTIRIWDAGSGRLLATLIGHTAAVSALDFSPDGQLLVSGGDDYTIRIWDANTGGLLRTLRGHASLVKSVRFSADGRYLASASSDNSAKIWDTSTWSELHTLTGHASRVRTAVFSLDQDHLASGSFDNTIRIWNPQNGQLLHTLLGHADDVNAVAFSPDSRSLASGGSDGIIGVWDLASGEVRLSFAVLPGDKWFAHRPGQPFYSGSPGVEEFVALRMNHELDNLRPLRDHASELRVQNLQVGQERPLPDWQPETLMDPQASESGSEGGVFWLIAGIFVLLAAAVGWFYFSQKQSDPLHHARRFFVEAGFRKTSAIASDKLLLKGGNGQMSALACLWTGDSGHHQEGLVNTIYHQKKKENQHLRVYIVYDDRAPSGAVVRQLRNATDCDTVPLHSALLSKTIAEKNCEQVLREFEAPYVRRRDPYSQFTAVRDPNWFFGREEFLNDLPSALLHGQNIGLFGLSKIGKSSLAHQIRLRVLDTPTAFLDCQSQAGKVEHYFEEVIRLLRLDLDEMASARRLPTLSPYQADFRRNLLRLFEVWNQTGSGKPFIVILDGIDQLFSARKNEQANANLVHRFLEALQDVAVNYRCLSLMVVGFRPYLSRNQHLPNSSHENPFCQKLQEEHLGFLREPDNDRLLSEIGAWQNIVWEPMATERAFHYTGGHPLITRLFASLVCKQGYIKEIDARRVDETAHEVSVNFAENEIGRYYRLGVWAHLTDEERLVVKRIAAHEGGRLGENSLPVHLQAALASLENLGLVASDMGVMSLTSQLHHLWIQSQAP